MIARTRSLDDFVRLIVRGRWLVLIPFSIGLAAAPLLSRFAPALYRSEAMIMVVPQRVPDNYVKPTISETIEQRLPSITDQILSRSRLEQIIQEMDLYRVERAHEVMEDVVQTMRHDITTTAVGKDVNSFRVSYVGLTAESARKVTERLASLYIEQNLRDRESQADSTSQFLAAQLEEAKRRLIEQEKKLENYRRSHAGQLPSQLPGNLQAIQNATMLLQALNESTNRAQERRLLIERQIVDTQTVAIPTMPVPSQDAVPTSTPQQLEIARARRTLLLQRYTPGHPEVVSIEQTIAELAARLEAETPLSASSAVEKTATPAEALQRKKTLDLQAELAVIDHQLNANRAEETRLKQIVAGYQANVDVVPTRESELVELTRDYGTLQAAYASLLMKKEESVIAANLERRQIGEQFKLLDVASLPEKPYNRNQRLAMLMSGAVAGLLVGVLVIGMQEYRDSSFRSEDEVERVLSIPTLALIPIMTSDREVTAAKWRGRIVNLAGTAALLVAGAVLLVWRFRA